MGNRHLHPYVLSGTLSMCYHTAHHTQGDTELEMDRRQLSTADHTWNSAVYGNQSACAYLSAGITMSANNDDLKIERTIYAKGNGK